VVEVIDVRPAGLGKRADAVREFLSERGGRLEALGLDIGTQDSGNRGPRSAGKNASDANGDDDLGKGLTAPETLEDCAMARAHGGEAGAKHGWSGLLTALGPEVHDVVLERVDEAPVRHVQMDREGLDPRGVRVDQCATKKRSDMRRNMRVSCSASRSSACKRMASWLLGEESSILG
jgi:hypothetical protein